MIKPLEELKLDFEKLAKEKHQAMNHISEGYTVRETAVKKNNLTNITNIGEAHAVIYGYGQSDTPSVHTVQGKEITQAEATDVIHKTSEIVLDLTKKIEGKGE